MTETAWPYPPLGDDDWEEDDDEDDDDWDDDDGTADDFVFLIEVVG